MGEPFFELSEVDSSNNYAMQQVQAHLAGHGATWFAHYQTAGKGQRGKQWNAEPGQNIMMSCVFEPKTLSIDNQFVLNAIVALSCFDCFNKYAVDKTSIKWPNDIYWGDRKAGGILIENVLNQNTWKYSIVGIGLNINQTLFPKDLPNPVSLKQITGQTFDVVALAKELCNLLDSRWRKISATSFEELRLEYSNHLYKLNQPTFFKKENTLFNALVKGVSKKGELLLETDQQLFAFNSIVWVLT